MTRCVFLRTIRVCLCGLAAAGGLVLPAGCAETGAWAYVMGVGRNRKIKPQYTLPEGRVLVLVDDPGEKVRWPRARDLLGRYLGEELLAHKATKTMISPDSLARFRQMDAAFETHAANKVGRMLGADTVIWLEVRDFFAPTDIQDTSTAAKMTVSVKVLNARELHEKRNVRLWPEGRAGHIIETELNAMDVNRLKGEHAASKELARRCALTVGRLFYEYTFGDLDDDRG